MAPPQCGGTGTASWRGNGRAVDGVAALVTDYWLLRYVRQLG